MVKIEIVESLFDEIESRFKKESSKIFNLMESLKENPRKGKPLGNVGGIVIKELKYRNFRFYFITDGFKLKFIGEESLIDLLIRFVRMSGKKHQQEAIREIRRILQTMGPAGFR